VCATGNLAAGVANETPKSDCPPTHKINVVVYPYATVLGDVYCRLLHGIAQTT
jgi:hypothetical protein